MGITSLDRENPTPDEVAALLDTGTSLAFRVIQKLDVPSLMLGTIQQFRDSAFERRVHKSSCQRLPSTLISANQDWR